VRRSLSRRRFVGVLAVLTLAAPALAQDPRASEAQRAAREWLAYTDAVDAPGSWQRAGQKFRTAVPLDEWTKALKKEREPRGKTEQRTMLSTELRRDIPGYEEGDYALIRFRTAFANSLTSNESLTLQREPDGVWRVVGYFIR
jgi:hypothetical protein